MSAEQQTPCLSAQAEAALPTSAATDDNLVRSHTFAEEWQAIIDGTLIEWERSPELLAEDELIPPSIAAVDSAIRLARSFAFAGQLPPLRVVPDGSGGIVLERWGDKWVESFEINDKGQIEFVLLRNGQVVERMPVPLLAWAER